MRQRRAHAGGLVVLAMLAYALGAGCEKSGDEEPQAQAGLTKSAQRGPVQMTVRVDKSQISIAEKMSLTIEVIAEPGVDVQMPSFGEKLSEFEILDFHERAGIPVGSSTGGQAASGTSAEGGRGESETGGSTGGQAASGTSGTSAASGTTGRKWLQEYVLESFLSGELEVPAITVKFQDARDPAAVKDGEVATEPVKIEVASLLEGEFDPTKFADIKGTVELPADSRWSWKWAIAAAAGLVVVAALASLLIRRKRRVAVAKPISPYDWAFFALQRLEEDRLIESGRVQEFYFRLSGIVRGYIERRFGLMAPERTTPEFLAEVQADPKLSTEHKILLGEFLHAADLVKFARYEPGADEVAAALSTARDFVEQTAAQAELTGAPANATGCVRETHTQGAGA